MSTLKCLIVMPFRTDFDPVFRAVQAAAEGAVAGQRIDCYWLKDVHAAGRITDDILDGLQKSAFCVADLTGNNPNVMWETGYAMALGKPTILIGQSVETLPFDLKVHRVLPYRADALDELGGRLAEAIRQTLARYAVPSAPASTPNAGSAPVIAVTGTTGGDRARVRRRVETLLEPYLPAGALWYCGSFGVVDEQVLDFLLGRGQRVVVVGYHQFDFSPEVYDLVHRGRVTFLDASLEPTPRGLTGPSTRDVLFASKADLVMLFWDGESAGTRELLGYYQENGKNLLLGYI